MSRTIPTILALLLLAPALRAQDASKTPAPSGEAADFARKVADTLKQTHTVAYKATYAPTGWVAQRVPSVDGTATIGKQSKHKIDPFVVDVKIRKSGSEEVTELKGGTDGDQYFLIDPKSKTCYKDLDPAVQGGQSRNLARIVLRDFAAPEPLADILKSGEIELRGDVKIGDEDCRELYMKHADSGTMIWAVSKKDHLPRKVTRLIQNDQGEATTELTLSDLVVNPQFVRNPFEMVCPEDYKKTDDFAP
jgi:hypothetical protein